jgi:hypothetical protein
MQVYIPIDYLEATQAEREAICGGCGGGRGWTEKIVPDHLLGVCIREACCIHDWMYRKGVTPKDKEFADIAFYHNMLAIIEDTTSCFVMKWLREKEAFFYYAAVKYFEGYAFWKTKQPAYS